MNTNKIATEIAAAAEFTGTKWSQLIDAPLIAAHILSEIDGIKDYASEEYDSITLTRVDGETMTFSIEVDVEEGEEVDTLIVAGWSWATYDGERVVVTEGGAPINNADDLAGMIDTIADWAAH